MATKKRLRKRSTVQVSVSKRPVDAELVRQKIRSMVANHAYDMTRAMISEAVDGGSIAAMKFLLELAGIFPANPEMEETNSGESLAKTLLERLGLPEKPFDEPQPV